MFSLCGFRGQSSINILCYRSFSEGVLGRGHVVMASGFSLGGGGGLDRLISQVCLDGILTIPRFCADVRRQITEIGLRGALHPHDSV